MVVRLPRSWSSAFEQWRRDVSMVRRRLAGDLPSPLVRGTLEREFGRSASKREHPEQGANGEALAHVPHATLVPRELVVARVVRETSNAVTLVFAAPSEDTFAFRPGQFFTVVVPVGDTLVSRNYSASNVPGTRELHLTVKEKEGGRASGVLCRTTPGQRLSVLGPFGSFVVPACPSSTARTLILVAGGAGITPLASIARSVLLAEPSADVVLVYGNRRLDDAIFREGLEELERTHAARFVVHHVVEEDVRTTADAASKARMGDSPASTGAQGAVARRRHPGRLDRTTARRILESEPRALRSDALFFVCGPDGMREEVLAALTALGHPEANVFVERFALGPRRLRPTNESLQRGTRRGEPHRLAVRLGTRVWEADASPETTLLDAGLAARIPMPFSCGVGGCGACRVRLVAGEVEMEEPNCLTDAERGAGYVLACVGRPSSACSIEIREEEMPS